MKATEAKRKPLKSSGNRNSCSSNLLDGHILKLTEYVDLLKCPYYHPHGTRGRIGYSLVINTSGIGCWEPNEVHPDCGNNTSLMRTKSEMLSESNCMLIGRRRAQDSSMCVCDHWADSDLSLCLLLTVNVNCRDKYFISDSWSTTESMYNSGLSVME